MFDIRNDASMWVYIYISYSDMQMHPLYRLMYPNGPNYSLIFYMFYLSTIDELKSKIVLENCPDVRPNKSQTQPSIYTCRAALAVVFGKFCFVASREAS